MLNPVVAKQFNRASGVYEEHASVQKRMAERLAAKAFNPSAGYAICPEAGSDKPWSDILEIGCGTGLLTRLLLEKSPESAITAVDIAEQMIRTAQENLAPGSRVRFIAGDAETMEWPDPSGFDLVVSNAAFQWFKHPSDTIRALAGCLRPGGRLLASTFGPQTFRELNALFREVEDERQMPQRRHSLPLREAGEWEAFLLAAGMRDVAVHARCETWHFDDCRSFLRSIKAVGASYSESSESIGAARRLLLEVMDRYDRRFKSAAGVYATYETIEISGYRN
ncbi:malonyl-ACP O-methyltransferase BioC [Paenibacillus sp. MBLB4367]|uniref:malonyl-ACP O-methyltransferase BioC n=1 Tax=Paenibacillus sp. MBLB4367 TaxID=3384767 RepID=UPI00390830DF